MAKKKKAPAATGTSVTVKLSVQPGEGTETYYVNHAEVGGTQHDFTIMFAQIPAKPSRTVLADASKSGELRIDASVQVTFPTSLISGLIRALTTQKEMYNKRFGVTLVEPEANPSGTRKYEH
jgi:hypothetical protein